jgi:hypothetical protein
MVAEEAHRPLLVARTAIHDSRDVRDQRPKLLPAREKRIAWNLFRRVSICGYDAKCGPRGLGREVDPIRLVHSRHIDTTALRLELARLIRLRARVVLSPAA